MTVHVVGAGLAGLGAATALAQAGVPVEVSEAAAQAGGRCRSYFDAQLGLTIDNGNHLVLSGNPAVHAYQARIGASDRLAGPAETEFPFVDLATGERWTVRPNAGPVPWWIFAKDRGVPGATLGDYLGMGALAFTNAGKRVDQAAACQGPVWDKLMRPFLLAALNLAPEGGSAELSGAVIRETLLKGGRAYAPRIPSPGLAAAFVDPALARLKRFGAAVQLQRRLTRLETEAGRVKTLVFHGGQVALAPDDRVILAVPPWVAAELLPGLTVPDEFESIVNGHFKTAPLPGAPLITGVLNSTVEWIFCFEDRISVTVSGANSIINEAREKLAGRLWAEVAQALSLPADLPPWQIVKEKRATFAATVEQNAKRPAAKTDLANLVLAGDWTATGLPATIEGALRSGETAARIVREGMRA